VENSARFGRPAGTKKLSGIEASSVTRLVVGIDLGTTHTVVAWTDLDAPSSPQIFEMPQLVSAGEIASRPLLPSFLYAPLAHEASPDPWSDAPWVIGEHARRRGQEAVGRLVSSAKSWLSHAGVDREAAILPWGAADDPSLPRLSPLEATARLLSHVRRSWNEAHPRAPLERQQIVLTVPASFDQMARELTVRAARQSGLSVRLLEEPQAAFYDFMARAGDQGVESLLGRDEEALVLVCDVGGGTTDLTLIAARRTPAGAPELTRAAVGRHLLLGGDNMDLALAHRAEARLVEAPARLDAPRFAELVLACRAAKERLLGEDAPASVPITLLGRGSSLVGTSLTTALERDDVEAIVLEGFFPFAARDAEPARRRSAIVGFGLPYEQDPAITRHVAAFFARHSQAAGPRAVLLNGGVFHAPRVAARLADSISSWAGSPVELLPQPEPDLAVAKGAVVYGLALAGHGPRVGGGAAHGYYVGLESGGAAGRAVCVVPRGAKEGERQLAPVKLALRVGRPVRFELFAADSGKVHAPGEIVALDRERFEALPPVATTITDESSEQDAEVPIALEGELSAIGTLELACVEAGVPSGTAPRRFRLAFELRGNEPELARRFSTRPPASAGSRPPSSLAPSQRPGGSRFEQACEAIQRVFGKGREDVKPRETKDLIRELERLLGERRGWTAELNRALFDVVGPKHRARKRSADHERVYWMLAGYCLRPGFGHPLDPQRVRELEPLFAEGLVFGDETRGWQQLFIAFRRVAGGLGEDAQLRMRALLDPFLAPRDAPLKKPKGFKPQPVFELLELASCLERVPPELRDRLGQYIVEKTFADRDPRLWAALGRVGARQPAYASVHHVVSARGAERFLDHLLREKWQEVPSAPRAALQLARVTGDRARDVSDAVRQQVARQLERAAAPAEWIRAVLEHVPVEQAEQAEFFGEELPVGLRLLEE
jgi:molecular chaperone DnaK (HSP70)